MRRRPAVRGAIAATVVALSVWAAPAARAGADEIHVSAIDNVFDPEILRIQPGQTVGWTMDGRSPHSVTADDASWDSGVLQPGATFTHAFDRPGTYTYHCSLHGAPGVGMTGTILVGDAATLPGSAAGAGPGREAVPHGYAPTVRVPQDFDTIQGAVDDARPGGMVLIGPGVYRESVTVTTPYLTIRGTDRNRTIIDGGFERANGIQVFEADGVAIENLTSRDNLLNGVSWNGVHGYWGRYLTVYDNGDYGIFAYDSDHGQLDHSYASGSPDSGFYVGQCDPCDAVVTEVVSAGNAAGFSGTNAAGVAVVNSEWTDNLSGIVPNTLDSEEGPPQHDMLIAGNYVHDNGNPGAPTLALTYPTFGMGIVVTGGLDDLITGNLIEDQPTYGVVVLPMLDRNLWPTAGNQVRDNVVHRSGLADLALAAPSAGGDCFAGNSSTTSQPAAIQLLYPCDGWRPFPGGGGSLAPTLEALTRYVDASDGSFPHGAFGARGAPPPQPGMPGDAAAAPPTLAIPGDTVPQPYRIRPVAEIHSAAGPTVSKELSVMGMPLATSWWGLLIGLYGYVLPFVLYTAWVAIALWDLIRQEARSLPHRTRWMLVVLVVPFVGPLLYFAFGRSPIPRQLRLILTVGGIAIYAAFVVIGTSVGG
jgi:plastocyanin